MGLQGEQKVKYMNILGGAYLRVSVQMIQKFSNRTYTQDLIYNHTVIVYMQS
jgi:hypothetical protein